MKLLGDVLVSILWLTDKIYWWWERQLQKEWMPNAILLVTFVGLVFIAIKARKGEEKWQ